MQLEVHLENCKFQPILHLQVDAGLVTNDGKELPWNESIPRRQLVIVPIPKAAIASFLLTPSESS